MTLVQGSTICTDGTLLDFVLKEIGEQHEDHRLDDNAVELCLADIFSDSCPGADQVPNNSRPLSGGLSPTYQ